MWGYQKQDVLADVSLISAALLTTYLLRFTLFFEDYHLSLFFRCIIYLIDVSVFTAAFISLQGRGAILVFYIFRIVQLVYADTFDIDDTILISILAYVVFKGACLLITNNLGLSSLDPNIKKLDEQQNRLQEKRRYLCLLLLAICSFTSIGLSTMTKFAATVGLTSFFGLGIGVVQVALAEKAEVHQTKIIISSFHYNLYLLVGATSLIGYINHGSWLYHAQPLVFYMVLIFLLFRLLIGAQSTRFHRDDRDIFGFIYPFSHEHVFKKYFNSDRHSLLPKVIDKLSRKLALLIYLTAAALATQGKGYLWLPISVFLINNYRIENDLERPFSLVEKRMNIKLRLNITLPLLFLAITQQMKEPCFKTQIFETVSGCGDYYHWQYSFTLVVAVAVILSQFIPEKKMKVKVQKGVAYATPLLIFMLIIGLECQSIQSFLLLAYALALCIEVIKDDRIAVVKGSKEQ